MEKVVLPLNCLGISHSPFCIALTENLRLRKLERKEVYLVHRVLFLVVHFVDFLRWGLIQTRLFLIPLVAEWDLFASG